MSNKKTLLIQVGSALAVALLGTGLWFVYQHFNGQENTVDISLQKAFSKISAIRAYSQNIKTQTVISDRLIKIEGTYKVDSSHDNYASAATTTLYITGSKQAHVFTLQNVSLQEDVYAKIDTTDPLLSASIQHSPTWLHFKSTAIPASYEGIAVAGPIQDNLKILSDGGTWLTLVSRHGLEKWGEDSLLRYSFVLSKKTPPQEGALSATLARIGSGTVDIWIDPTTFMPKYLRFENAPYFSTTTIQNINALSPITAPEVSSS